MALQLQWLKNSLGAPMARVSSETGTPLYTVYLRDGWRHIQNGELLKSDAALALVQGSFAETKRGDVLALCLRFDEDPISADKNSRGHFDACCAFWESVRAVLKGLNNDCR